MGISNRSGITIGDDGIPPGGSTGQVLAKSSGADFDVYWAVGGSGGGHVIEDEGTPLPQRTNLNFVGAGVAATDDAGNDATVVTISGGGSGTPGGSDTQVQFNDAGSFGGDAGFTYDKTTDTVTVVGAVNAGGRLFSNTSLVLEETGAGADTITVQAPASIAASYTLTLPINDGGSGDVLSTDGSGVLSWFGMTAALLNKISADGTTTTTNTIPFGAFGLTSEFIAFDVALNNGIVQNTANRDQQFNINGAQAFKLDIVSGHESNYDLLFPSAKGPKLGSLVTPTGHIYDSGSGTTIDSRLSGTNPTNILHDLRVATSSDVYSYFGTPGTSTIVAPSNAVDRLVTWKVDTSTAVGARRSGTFIAEGGATSNSSARLLGSNSLAVINSSATGNYVSTTNGGGISNRAMAANQSTTTVVSFGGAFSGKVQGKTFTEAYNFLGEAPTVDSGITWATFSHYKAQFTAPTGTITTAYGYYADSIPSGFAGTAYQGFFVGTGARHGWYFNQSSEYIRASGTNILELGAASSVETTADFKLNTVGKGIYIKTGTNATAGTATLSAGTVTVNTTKVTANSMIFLTHQTTTGTPGVLSVGTVTAGTSFVINSTSVLDANTVAWWIVEPA